MAKTSKVVSLADRLCEPGERTVGSWFTKQPPDVQAELLEVKRRIKAGECLRPKAEVSRDTIKALGLSCAEETISRWLRR